MSYSLRSISILRRGVVVVEKVNVLFTRASEDQE